MKLKTDVSAFCTICFGHSTVSGQSQGPSGACSTVSQSINQSVNSHCC